MSDEKQNWQIAQSDAIELMTSMEAGSADLVIMDPAYESLEKHRKVGTTTRLKVSDGSSNAWFDIFPNRRYFELFQACYRAMAKNSHIYVICDQETHYVVKQDLKRAGFKWWRFLVWDKMAPGMGYHYRGRHELVCFAEKGKRKLNDLGVADVIQAKRVVNGYPTEKPVELLRVLVEQSSSPGQLVVDPFCGSASTGEAALITGRRFSGGDVSVEAVARGRKRLAAVANPRQQALFGGP
jgi:site-specific DNA-methyltransferase (adenine-specific)